MLVFATDPKKPDTAPDLCGFFPLVLRRGYKGVPVRYLTLWQHDYSYCGAPLLRRETAAACLAYLFDSVVAQQAALVDLPLVPGHGRFHNLLVDYLHASGRLSYEADCYSRGLLIPHADAETYLAATMPGKRRKGLNRLLRRLGDTGDRLEFRTLEPGEALQPWLDDFLKLEASGWKGARALP